MTTLPPSPSKTALTSPDSTRLGLRTKEALARLVRARALQSDGAGNEARTRDLNLGKVALYQLSYSRFVRARRLYWAAAASQGTAPPGRRPRAGAPPGQRRWEAPQAAAAQIWPRTSPRPMRAAPGFSHQPRRMIVSPSSRNVRVSPELSFSG